MRLLLPFASAALAALSISASTGAELPVNHLEIRIIEADRGTATLVLEALEAADQDTDALADQLDGLEKQRKLRQRARFAESLAGGPGEATSFRKQLEAVQVEVPKTDAKLQLGIDLEGDANPGIHGVTALRLQLDITTPADRKSYQSQRLATGVEIPDRRWILASRWGTSDEDTLVLCRTSCAPRPAPENPPLIQDPVRYVRLDLELYEATAADLDTVVTKSAGREEKACEWLKGRAKLIHHGSVIVRPGMIAVTMDTLSALNPDDAKNGKRLPGWSPTVLPYVGPEGRLVDLQFNASWTDEDEGAYHFSGPQTCSTGVPAFFPGEPSDKNDSKAMLLVATPTVVTMFEGLDRSNNRPKQDGSADEPYLKRYAVHPAFFRILGGQGGQNPQPPADPFGPPIPGGPIRITAKDALINRGMDFPEGTHVLLSIDASRVTLQQTREGHEAFEALLKELTP